LRRGPGNKFYYTQEKTEFKTHVLAISVKVLPFCMAESFTLLRINLQTAMTAVGMMPHMKTFKLPSQMTTGAVTQQGSALLRYRSAETRRNILE